MNKRFWTGIGQRGYLSKEITNQQITIGSLMAFKGWSLLTGGAKRSDFNFLKGAVHLSQFQSNAHVIRHVNNQNYSGIANRAPTLELMEDSDMAMVKEYYFTHGIFKEEHFNKLDSFAQELHARNFFQIMDESGKVRSEFVAYAAPENRWGVVSGGTRTAVAVARIEKLPIFNLKLKGQYDAIMAHIKGLPDA